jgi:hypothetical protein
MARTLSTPSRHRIWKYSLKATKRYQEQIASEKSQGQSVRKAYSFEARVFVSRQFIIKIEPNSLLDDLTMLCSGPDRVRTVFYTSQPAVRLLALGLLN